MSSLTINTDAANDIDMTYRVYTHLAALPHFATVDANTYLFHYIKDKAVHVETGKHWKAANHPDLI